MDRGSFPRVVLYLGLALLQARASLNRYRGTLFGQIFYA